MSGRAKRALPENIWTAFIGFLVIGIVMGSLVGFGTVGGGVLLVVVFGGLGVFVPWAVLRLDPLGLAELSVYSQDQDQVDGGQGR
jgi:hypothetical protein